MKRICIVFLLCVMAFGAYAQNVELIFTGRDTYGNYVRLSQVDIENQSRNWTETLTWPDTTLLLINVTDIVENETDIFPFVGQNVPNPFDGVTELAVNLAEGGSLHLSVYTVSGRLLSEYHGEMPSGVHRFRISVAQPQACVVVARSGVRQGSAKILNKGHGIIDRVEYLGSDGFVQKGLSVELFGYGDNMRYVGYATISGRSQQSNPVTQVQNGSETISLVFNSLPQITTGRVSDITDSTATCGGNVTHDGGATVTARGVCWSTSQDPVVSGSHTADGNGMGSFTSTLTGLNANTTYYVRAYATNSVGTVYGSELSFTSGTGLPTVSTTSPSNINDTSATCGGNVTNDGGTTVTARGVCWDTLPSPTVNNLHSTDGSGTGSFTSSITGLTLNTTYYVRAYATNSAGTAYGEERIFSTATLPTVITSNITDITGISSTSGGNVTSDGGMSVTARGVCWSTSHNPTISGSHTNNGSGVGSFSAVISELNVGATYYVRAYATNGVGTSYGNEVNFTTMSVSDGSACPGAATVTDGSGNTYNTIWLGRQCWMKENLRTKKYADGATIAQGNDTSSTIGYWYYPNNSSSNMSTYGLLYNWKAVMRNESTSSSNPSYVQGVCPNGWHVPSHDEWTQLTDYVSSQSQYVCGSDNTYIAKALAGVTGWTSYTGTCFVGDTPSANNATGFGAPPAGRYSGSYVGFGIFAAFWSATEYSISSSYTRSIINSSPGIDGNGKSSNVDSRSVRCIRDVVTMDGQPCPNTPILTDRDGNVYNTVMIGSQCWMKENLRTTKYSDGASISHGNDTSTTMAYWYFPDSVSSNKGTYGLLYNWKAVMRNSSSSNAYSSEVQGICPVGWHVPSFTELRQLFDCVRHQGQYACSGDNAYIAKSLASTEGWDFSDNTCAVGNMPSNNNITGFGAMPAGYYRGNYFYFGMQSCIWSSTEYDSDNALLIGFRYDCATGFNWYGPKNEGNSVRCLRDGGGSTASQVPTVTTSTTTASSITSTSATCGGNVTSDGGATVTERGVYWSTSPNPEVNGSRTSANGSGTGSFTVSLTGLTPNTTYYVKAYATNSVGTGYGSEVSFTTNSTSSFTCGTTTLTDVDGNTYNTVQIGQQCWMKENLRTKKYADGTSISQGSETSTTVAYWYYPNNNSSNFSTYGLLYNWKAVMRNSSSSSGNPSGVQGICPTGWHVPSNAEWTQLTNYVGSRSDYVCSNTSTYIAKALAGTTGWNSSTNTCAVGNTLSSNNATGFNALPAGYYYSSSYSNFGNRAVFWSATENGSNSYDRTLRYENAEVYRYSDAKSLSGSVRCLQDESSVTTPTVTTAAASSSAPTSATCGGNVTSDGGATVTVRGVCWNTSHNPTTSNSHTTDGSGTGSFSSSITGLAPSTTYYVRAYATNSIGTAYGNEVSFTTTASNGQHVISISLTTDAYGNETTWEVIDLSNDTILASGGPYNFTDTGSVVQNIPDIIVDGSGCYVFIIYDSYGDGICCSEGNGYYSVSYDGTVMGNGGNSFYQQTHLLNPSSNSCNRDEIALTSLGIPIYQLPNTSFTINGVVANKGVNTISSYTMRYRVDGGEWSADNTLNCEIIVLGSQNFTHNVPLSFSTIGNHTIEVMVFNPNGIPDNTADNSIILDIVVRDPSCPNAATLTDVDGNTYNTVLIGNQCWMRENLRTTHYADNTPISQGSDTSSTIGYWYYPNGNSSNVSTYGLLYNWKAVMRNSSSSSANPSGVQGICPTGWHVPSDAEWTQLTSFVTSQSEYVCSTSSSIAKALASTTGWYSSTNACAVGNTPSSNNGTGFSALPAGYYNVSSSSSFRSSAYLWSATEYSSSNAYYRFLYNGNTGVSKGNNIKTRGYSVRCLRD